MDSEKEAKLSSEQSSSFVLLQQNLASTLSKTNK